MRALNAKEFMHTLQVTSKKIGKGKTAFTVYKALFGKLWVDVKFTKDSENKVKETANGDFLTVNSEDINISTNENGYPVLWVR